MDVGWLSVALSVVGDNLDADGYNQSRAPQHEVSVILFRWFPRFGRYCTHASFFIHHLTH